MSYEIGLIRQAQLARYYHQSLGEILGRRLTWLDKDILQRWMVYELGKMSAT